MTDYLPNYFRMYFERKIIEWTDNYLTKIKKIDNLL